MLCIIEEINKWKNDNNHIYIIWNIFYAHVYIYMFKIDYKFCFCPTE